jgi:hypothetical protein
MDLTTSPGDAMEIFVPAACEAITARWPHSPRVGLILGSGLGAAASALTDTVTIRTTTGRELHQEVRFPKGNAQLPLSLDELREKFVDCAAGAPLDSGRLFDRLCALESAGALAGGVARLAA